MNGEQLSTPKWMINVETNGKKRNNEVHSDNEYKFP